jgi:hypothetical protein
MPLITTTTAVTAIWAGLELMGRVISEETIKGAARPITDSIGKWIKKISGWEAKHREKVFREAYLSAEDMLIKQIGITEAYRTFRTINRIADEGTKREFFILAILEESDISRRKILDTPVPSNSFATPEIRNAFGIQNSKDIENFSRFAKHIRQSLSTTEIYKPFIEIYASEDAKALREQTLFEISKLSKTIDSSLNAIRVKIIESADFQKERQVYLKQLEAYLEEQEFIGFPDLREQKTPLLLNSIYIPLRLQYERGGEKIEEEISKLITSIHGENQDDIS